jgi:hypothetical protein
MVKTNLKKRKRKAKRKRKEIKNGIQDSFA